MLTNNDIMKKLRVALKLRDTDIVEILAKADFSITSSELGAIFRNTDHPNYKECGDQLLRNFLNGLIVHLRGPMPEGEKKNAAASSTVPKDNTSSSKNSHNKRNQGKELHGPQKSQPRKGSNSDKQK